MGDVGSFVRLCKYIPQLWVVVMGDVATRIKSSKGI